MLKTSKPRGRLLVEAIRNRKACRTALTGRSRIAFVALGCAMMAYALQGSRAVTILASDWESNSVRKIETSGSGNQSIFITSAAGLSNPSGVVRGPDGSLFVAGGANNIIKRFNAQTGQNLGTFATNAQTPIGIVFGADGNLYVASRDGGVLRYNGTTGASMGQFATAPTSDLWWAYDLTFGPSGDLFVTSFERGSVLRFDAITGAFLGAFASVNSSIAVSGLTFGPDGNLYVAGFSNGVIYRFNGLNGSGMETFATGLARPNDVEFGPDGNLYVSAERTPVIYSLDGTTGSLLATYATGGSGSGGFAIVPEPCGMPLFLLSCFFLLRQRRARNGSITSSVR